MNVMSDTESPYYRYSFDDEFLQEWDWSKKYIDQPDILRYLEAAVHGVIVACLYLPNGNPHPGPKFTYKLAWMDKLRARMAAIWAEEVPAVVLGDFNVIPEDDDVWSVKAMADDALMQPESRAAYARFLADGWTDALRTHNPRGGVWTYWDYQAGAWQRDAGFRIAPPTPIFPRLAVAEVEPA